jgi:catechol 2,3-dioxygenase-like lactoylglutathione lyase family enzyme
MNSIIRYPSFHHIELPCPDLELAERFYSIVFGAEVYVRRDASRKPAVPISGTIEDAEELGFQIDATYLRIGDSLRVGLIKGDATHSQRELDHLAFSIDESDLGALARKLTECKIEVVDQNAERLLIRDPFGLTLELWPRSVLTRMGLA